MFSRWFILVFWAIASSISLSTGSLPYIYESSVKLSNILNLLQVSSISSCYFKCWDEEVQCIAVGFLLGQISNKNIVQLDCYMIAEQAVDSGKSSGSITLEVMVT